MKERITKQEQKEINKIEVFFKEVKPVSKEEIEKAEISAFRFGCP